MNYNFQSLQDQQNSSKSQFVSIQSPVSWKFLHQKVTFVWKKVSIRRVVEVSQNGLAVRGAVRSVRKNRTQVESGQLWGSAGFTPASFLHDRQHKQSSTSQVARGILHNMLLFPFDIVHEVFYVVLCICWGHCSLFYSCFPHPNVAHIKTNLFDIGL